jgi:hypothetical protein
MLRQDYNGCNVIGPDELGKWRHLLSIRGMTLRGILAGLKMSLGV